ncbi:kinase-like domain-containing protein [Xylaria cf. heliscus]|nr:kinase-like domain-containing protein [Xylaria cf. heliscus]
MPESRIFSSAPYSNKSTDSDTSISYSTYILIEDVEEPSHYRPGGYHPIEIGDRLHNRYRVVHKLGYGSYSTTWLAVDEQMSKNVAVKVGISGTDMQEEADILSQLGERVAASCHVKEKTSMIPSVLDRFHLVGPNGNHPCFVTLPARCNLREVREASYSSYIFHLDVARSLAAQLTMAISLIHSLGYAHGDLHLGNLLLQLPSPLANLSVEQLYANFGAPMSEPVERVDGKPLTRGVPPHAILPLWLGVTCGELTLSEAKLLLNDFGTAFRPSDKSRFESYTPLGIRPPEALFEPTTPLSFASDIWSLGCTIFELISSGPLIDGHGLMAQQVHMQGPMPSEWWDKWETRSKWFDDAQKPLTNEDGIWKWDRLFKSRVQKSRQSEGMDCLNEEEEAALLGLLQWMLAWRPEERPNAEEVLNSAWMKKWALPAYEETRQGWA